jgi:hypothetical protein
VYRAPVYRAPVYRPAAPVFRAPAYRSAAPVFRAPVYRSPPPMYRPVPSGGGFRGFQARPAPMPRAAPPHFAAGRPGRIRR